MSKKASPAAIGGFVLGAVALVVVGIVVWSSGQLFREKTPFVSYFPGSVAGLNVGAPVQFQGVQIGEVTDIKLNYYVVEGRFDIPVHYQIWQDALRVTDEQGTYEWTPVARHERITDLIEQKGLRAVLSAASLVTGQYVVSLELRPETGYKYVGNEPGILEIPTVESTRDKLGSMLEQLDLQSLVSKATEALDGISALVNSQAIKDLPGKLDLLLADARKLVDDLDGKVAGITTGLDYTLADYRTLATTATTRITTLADALEKAAVDLSTLSTNVNAKVDPLARSVTTTMDQAKSTLKDYDGLVDPQSSTRSNLDVMLEEAAGAARSLRLLADYLEQNPDALIKGKY